MAASSNRKFPGFGLPVDHLGDSEVPLAIDGSWLSNGVTLREQRMMDCISQITDKPGWEMKVFDDDIVSRWRAESDGRSTADGDIFMSQTMFNYVCHCGSCRNIEVPG